LSAALLFFLAFPTSSLWSHLEAFTSGFAATRGRGLDVDAEVRVVTDSLPALMLILFVPVFAALLRVATRGPGGYVGRLVTALHFHTVAFVAWAMTSVVRPLGNTADVAVTTFLAIGLPLFLGASISRIYKLAWWRSLIRTVAVCASYVLLVGAVVGFLLDIVTA
jgi:hypothetical protein